MKDYHKERRKKIIEVLKLWPQKNRRDKTKNKNKQLVMAIQFERRPMESLETLAPPQRPARKNQFKPVQQNSALDSPNHQIHKFWSPKIAHQTQPMKQATEDIKGTKLSSLAQVIKEKEL